MYSFGEQLLHYFDRPHGAPPSAPVGGPAAWTGAGLAAAPGWCEELGPAEVDELQRAVATAAGRPLQALAREDFPLPALGAALRRWRAALRDGLGFALVRGVPVAGWSQAQAELAFWGLGLHLGIPGAQNGEGDLLGHVTDLSAHSEHPDERLYRTNRSIRFHCDAADAVGLLCLRASPDGGESRLVSSVSVFDELRATRPELAARLCEPLLLDARLPAGARVAYTPVRPCCFDGRRLRSFMHLDYFRSVERHPGAGLDPLARAALDAWEEIAERPGFHLDMQLRSGDLQLVSNHSVVHARRAYADDPAAPRHLLRLWLSLVG